MSDIVTPFHKQTDSTKKFFQQKVTFRKKPPPIQRPIELDPDLQTNAQTQSNVIYANLLEAVSSLRRNLKKSSTPIVTSSKVDQHQVDQPASNFGEIQEKYHQNQKQIQNEISKKPTGQFSIEEVAIPEKVKKKSKRMNDVIEVLTNQCDSEKDQSIVLKNINSDRVYKIDERGIHNVKSNYYLDSLTFAESDDEIKPSIEATPEQLGIHVLNERKTIPKEKEIPKETKLDIEPERMPLEEFPSRRRRLPRQTFTRFQESIPKKRKKKLSLREIVQQRKQQERWNRLKEFFTLFFTRFGEFVKRLIPLLLSFFTRALQLNPFTRTQISPENDGVESYTIYQNHNVARSFLMDNEIDK